MDWDKLVGRTILTILMVGMLACAYSLGMYTIHHLTSKPEPTVHTFPFALQPELPARQDINQIQVCESAVFSDGNKMIEIRNLGRAHPEWTETGGPGELRIEILYNFADYNNKVSDSAPSLDDARKDIFEKGYYSWKIEVRQAQPHQEALHPQLIVATPLIEASAQDDTITFISPAGWNYSVNKAICQPTPPDNQRAWWVTPLAVAIGLAIIIAGFLILLHLLDA